MDKKSGDVVKTGGADPLSPVHELEASSVLGSELDDENLTTDISDETNQIRADIDETRAEMGETIDAIQERLSYANISEQVSDQVNNAIETVKDSVYDATVGQVVNYMRNASNELSNNAVVRAVKNDPLPYILIGAGAGLIAYKSFSKKGLSNGKTARRSTGGDAKAGTGSSLYSSAERQIIDVKDKVAGAASTAYDGIASAATSTAGGARDLASRAYDGAGKLGTATKDKYEQYLDEKPMVIGALALAAGAAVGMSIPMTRYEGELMGDARKSLMTKAGDTASEFMNNAKEVAVEAGQNITDEISKKSA